MPNYTFTALKTDYAHMWAHMEIKSEKISAISSQANKIISNKNRYEEIQKLTGVPWYVIGLMHLRESDCDFSTHLHNGDPLTERTVHVPANRPPNGKAPFEFNASAVDALTMPGKEYNKITDWSIERIAYTFEGFNGFGYKAHGVASPYLWASTNQYISGKYIFDGPKGWRPSVVDNQLGAMAVLKIILERTAEQPTISVPTVITDDKPNTPTAEIPRPTTKEMNKVSRKHWWNDILKWLGIGGTVTTGVTKAANTLDLGTVSTTLNDVSGIATSLAGYGLLAICILLIVYAIYQSKLMKDDIQDGRATPSGEGNGAT